MTMKIHLSPELETRLREEAAHRGVNAEAYVLQTLESDLSQGRASGLSRAEETLLRDMNAGLTPETWKRYRRLSRRARAEKILPDEHRELIELSDQIEMANARRLEAALKYAEAKGISFEKVLKKFEIGKLGNG